MAHITPPVPTAGVQTWSDPLNLLLTALVAASNSHDDTLSTLPSTYVTFDGTNLRLNGAIIPITGSGGGSTGGGGIGIDTDGVPFYSPSGTHSIALDTDGDPYFT